MLKFDFEVDFDAEVVIGSIDRYGREFEKNAAEEAVAIMRSNIKIVSRLSAASPPGGFPYSRTGELPNSIEANETGDGYVVGPRYKKPPNSFIMRGSGTIAQLLNDGGVISVRRRVRRRGVNAVIMVRQQFSPRPYLELTLDIVAERFFEIATKIPMN